MDEAKNQSVLVKTGVRLENDEGDKIWLCLLSSTCREDGKIYAISKGSSTAASHVKDKHGIQAPKTQVTETNKRRRDEELNYITRSQLYTSDLARYCRLTHGRNRRTRTHRCLAELQVATLIVNNNLPLRFVEYEEFRIISKTMMLKGVNETMTTRRLKHVILEMWAHVVSKIKFKISSALQDLNGLSSISINCDGYTNKVSGRKFIGVRCFYVEENAEGFKFESQLLAMKPFAPTFALRQQGLVDTQFKYFCQVLEMFEIRQFEIFGGASDAGPDIKKLLKDKLKLNWEWCWSHEFSCAIKVHTDCLVKVITH